MTIAEMHLAWRMNLDKSGSLDVPSFLPEEIDFWLNAAIVRFVKTRFTGSDKGIGFEGNKKRTEDLRTLIAGSDYSLTNGDNYINSWRVDLSNLVERWFILDESVDIEYNKLGEPNSSIVKRQGITPCTLDTVQKHLEDPYSEHRLHYEEAKPLRLISNDRVELITDGDYNIITYYMNHLKRPAVVSLSGEIDCDLPEHTHDEIVGLATSMVLENIEQPRYQTQLNELNRME
jgi:hypothetical protein